MLKPTQTLPDDYKRVATLDLSKDLRLAIALNLLGIVLFFGCLLFFLWLTAVLRQQVQSAGELTVRLDASNSLLVLVGMVGLIFASIVLHELVHALFFWLFTRQRAVFGFKGLYAFAAAPRWYIPRNQHLVITVAPLLLISLLGIGLIPLVAEKWLPPLLLILISNAAGAIGDIVTLTWLLSKPASAYINDYGDGFHLYLANLTQQV
ncbi:DUF3267 domain-containing protein [Almyronema epifaneia]|uniref:DUF3267 domain-containing protein n=1 Tax=Almyronema epifaneia S1 TaxID=2991925 RepID=A0ABW6ID66_9CYAN